MSVTELQLDSPHLVMSRLTEIEQDLANRQNLFEDAARNYFTAQRDMRRAHATALLTSERASVTEKKAEADLAADLVDGAEYEAEYEASKAVIRMLEQRSTILMSVLKSQGRA